MMLYMTTSITCFSAIIIIIQIILKCNFTTLSPPSQVFPTQLRAPFLANPLSHNAQPRLPHQARPSFPMQCITDITEFQNSSQTKAKAIDQLKYALLIGEDKITKHTELLLKSLVRVWLNAEEVPDCRKRVWQVVEVIGYFVSSGYYLPLAVNILGQEEYKNSTKSTIALLNILGHMLLRSESLEEHLPIITKALSGYEAQFVENDEGLTALLDIANTLICRLPTISPDFLHIAFQILVSV